MPPSFVSTNRGKSLPMFFENIGAKVLHATLFTGANDGHRPCTLHGCNPQTSSTPLTTA